MYEINATYFLNVIAANIVKDTCPDTCPCCNSGNQTFEHWLLECPMFNYHRSKYLYLTDTSLNNINLNFKSLCLFNYQKEILIYPL